MAARLRSLLRPLASCIAIPLLCLALTGGADDSLPQSSPEAILRRAFDNLFDCDMRSVLSMTLHNRRGEAGVRRAEIARKRIENRLHSYGRFIDPPWMRGTALLIVDNDDRSDDHFLFLPQQSRVRRITTARRNDSFLGTDLWYEDLERRYPDQYQVISRREDVYRDEEVDVVLVVPIKDSQYARVEFVIARSDALILLSEYYSSDAEVPFKTVESLREGALERDGHVLPRRITAHNHSRKTWTEVEFEQLEINPPLSDSLFTAAALEAGRSIPGLDGE